VHSALPKGQLSCRGHTRRGNALCATMGWAMKQFVGGMVIITFAAIMFRLANQSSTDWGSVADWVSGLVTAGGVWVAVQSARQAILESQRLELMGRHDRIEAENTAWMQRYGATFSAVAVGINRIGSCELVFDRSGATVTRITLLTMRRAVEADLRLVQSVEIVGLDPEVCHQMTSFAGILAAAADVIDELNRHAAASPAIRAQARLAALQSIKALREAAQEVVRRLDEAVSAALIRRGLPSLAPT